MVKKTITQSEFAALLQQGLRDFSEYRMEVTELYCYNNQLRVLPELPLVQELSCYNSQLQALPELPLVQRLYCYNNQLTTLPELPLVQTLHCSHNQLTTLPELPLVRELYCYNNQLTALPELPLVQELNCSHNQLTTLPELPLARELYCAHNQLTTLPELPLVRELYCSHNQLQALPALPLVQRLSCDYNQLRVLPELPLVHTLYCSHNPLQALPAPLAVDVEGGHQQVVVEPAAPLPAERPVSVVVEGADGTQNEAQLRLLAEFAGADHICRTVTSNSTLYRLRKGGRYLVLSAWSDADTNSGPGFLSVREPTPEELRPLHRMLVSCRNSSGFPELVKFLLRYSDTDCQDGEHYEMARMAAEERSYQEPFLVFDESELPRAYQDDSMWMDAEEWTPPEPEVPF